jgi:hypothetical protein
MNDIPANNSKKSWRGSWDRPVSIDEQSYDALTIARMTDHNVRGNDSTSVQGVDWTEDVTIEESHEPRKPQV